MSESTLWPEERKKGTSQKHGADQQEEHEAQEIIHICSCSCRNKTGLTFYKRSSDREHRKKCYLHTTENEKGNSRNTVPPSQRWCADQEDLSTRRAGAMKDAT